MSQTHATTVPVYSPSELLGATHSSLCLLDYEFADAHSSNWTRFGGLSLGDIDVFLKQGIGTRLGHRLPHHIREDRIDDFVISMPCSARITLNQSDRSYSLEPGMFAFLPTARPSAFQIEPLVPGQFFSFIHVRVSSAALRRRIPQVDAMRLCPMKLGPGARKIMRGLFDLALTEGDELSGVQAESFKNSLIDTVASVALELPELSDASISRNSVLAQIRATAKAYIEGNLSNPSLDVGLVARHCRISVRYLHSAFSAVSESVGSYIREARLQQCRIALQNQSMRGRSVTEIAMMWGFNDPSYFARAYRAYFGKLPSKDRDDISSAGN